MSNILAKMNTWLCLAMAGMLAFSLFGMNGIDSQAYSTNWQKGVSFQSRGTEDFGSADFQQSVLNATTLGVNHISLVVTYYQYGRNDSSLYRGWNTPSDAALTSGTNYAKSLGLQVSYKLFVESNDGWRAYIQPGNKAQWFQQYSGIAVGLGKVAQASGAEMIVLGTEMVGVSAADQDPANTQYWYNLIAAVRSVYAGQLTYGGNWGGAYDEKNNIKFWDALDFIGVSAYYEPGRAGAYDVAGVQNFWANVDKNDLGPLSAKWGKEIIFTEVGYRSTDGSLDRPWEYGTGGNYNSYNQEVAYEGLLSYFSGVSYLKGMHMWDWDSNPAVGGEGNTNYTPWNKPAGQILKKFYNGTGTAPTPVTPAPTPTTPVTPPTTPVTPVPTPTPAPSNNDNQNLVFETSAVSTPESPIVGSSVALAATVKNLATSDARGAIVNVEVYKDNNRVYQNFQEDVYIKGGDQAVFKMNWTPEQTGEYKVKVGVFSGQWQNLYGWFNEIKTINVTETAVGGTPDVAEPDLIIDEMPSPRPSSPEPSNPEIEEEIDEELEEEIIGEKMIEVWWPGEGLNVSGVQPFKAVLTGEELNNYHMFWQVGGDVYNWMGNSSEEFAHKQAQVDLSSWRWNQNGTYQVTFIAQSLNGEDTHTKTVEINVV